MKTLSASEMLIDIIEINKNLIFGDYDVDGISSITILSSFFRYLNHPFKFVIPDRFIDGYGPNELLDQNLDKEINNIIFLDCGSNHDVINYLKTNNIKTIIIDHHIINNFDIPKSDILINPVKNKTQINDNNVCTATLTYFLIDLINKKMNFKFSLNEYFIFV